MTVFWSRAQHHVTTSLMKLAIQFSGCVKEYCFSIFVYFQSRDVILAKQNARAVRI